MTDVPLPSAPTTLLFLCLTAWALAVVLSLGAKALEGRSRVLYLGTWVVWVAATAGLAATGQLEVYTLPPPMGGIMLAMLILVVGLALSRAGRRIATATPLWTLIAVQAFRLPLEGVLYSWAEQGALPTAMTFAGYNFDIITGGLALVVGFIVYNRPDRARPLALAFNVWGLFCLGVIAVVAFGSLPTPLQYINVAVPLVLPTQFPYIWLPTVCVGGALFIHVLSLRQWWHPASATTTNADA